MMISTGQFTVTKMITSGDVTETFTTITTDTITTETTVEPMLITKDDVTQKVSASLQDGNRTPLGLLSECIYDIIHDNITLALELVNVCIPLCQSFRIRHTYQFMLTAIK